MRQTRRSRECGRTRARVVDSAVRRFSIEPGAGEAKRVFAERRSTAS